PEILYVGTEQGIFKSMNAGEQWIAINKGLADSSIETLAIDPKTSSTLYTGTSHGIVKSMNGGGRWTPVKTGCGTRAESSIANQYGVSPAVSVILRSLLKPGIEHRSSFLTILSFEVGKNQFPFSRHVIPLPGELG